MSVNALHKFPKLSKLTLFHHYTSFVTAAIANIREILLANSCSETDDTNKHFDFTCSFRKRNLILFIHESSLFLHGMFSFPANPIVILIFHYFELIRSTQQ